MVAILDALGAAAYTKEEADRFVRVRDLIIETVRKGLEGVEDFDTAALFTFTLNDSIVVAERCGKTLKDFNNFGHLLRYYQYLFLREGILLRGAFAVGEFFHLDKATSTVMGPAVTDAAGWYESADWMGVHSTPHTTLCIDELLHPDGLINHVLIEYAVPMKQGPSLRARAVNWPKLAYLQNGKNKVNARGQLLKWFSEQRVPKGTESKYQRSLDFFDHVMTLPQSKDEKAADKQPI
jgi:hypothetical protein